MGVSSTLAVVVVAALAWVVLSAAASRERMVGGKTEVADVRKNEEVQDLGRFSVEEYNRSVRVRREGEEELRFVKVMEAQQQVVSGIKYYMKILVRRDPKDPMVFDSVVVVKPWLHSNSKQLLHFAPSSTDLGIAVASC